MLTLVAAGSLPASATARLESGHTKRQAEVNVLRTVEHRWGARRLPGIVDPATHLLFNNTEAVCYGRGKRRASRRYARFTCIVRPHVHARAQGLYLTYGARPRGRFTIRWVKFRKH